MDFNFLSDLNYPAILVAAVAYFVIGAIWYSPILFGKKWQALVGMPEDAAKGMGGTMVLSLLGMIVISLVMAIFVGHIVPSDLVRGIKIALVGGIGFMVVPMWINSLYAKKPFSLLMIDSLYHLVSFVVMAIILTSWT